MEPALAAIRFAHYLAAMFVFGAAAFLVAFAPPELRTALSPRLRGVALAASVIALLSALAWLAMESASMNDDIGAAFDPYAVLDVLTFTAFGGVWQGRIALAAVTILALILTRADRWGAPTMLAGLLLASLSLVDHGAMQSGALGLAHRANDAVHLLATGGWLGGLPVFAMCLGARKDAAHVAMLRFSAAGHFGVVAILVTGAINIYLTTHAAPWPATSPYRALLIAKISVVLAMIALAVVNRYVLLPSIEDHPRRARALRLFALAEFCLAITAVALVSYFGLLDPA